MRKKVHSQPSALITAHLFESLFGLLDLTAQPSVFVMHLSKQRTVLDEIKDLAFAYD